MNDPGQLIQAAFAAIQHRDFATAERLVKQLLEMAPERPEVNSIAGMLAAQTGHL